MVTKAIGVGLTAKWLRLYIKYRSKSPKSGAENQPACTKIAETPNA